MPAVALLEKLGYRYVPAETLDAERDTLREPVLTKRLVAALTKLNPWLSPENVHKAIRAITHVPAASLLEANEKVYVALTHGVSLVQDGEGGAKGETVHFIDFDHPERNDLIVTRQYRVQGTKKQVRADVVLFVNGVPLALIESKSPTLGDKWLDEAVRQILRYQEIGDDFRDLGAPKLFEPLQVVVGVCGQSAFYGTVATPQRFWAQWKEPYPSALEELAERLGHKPSAQDVLVYGLLGPKNLLDLTRNFVVFEAERGRTIRKICRYKQFSAVNRTLERIHTAQKPEERGGVIWHTQGSGKSLTMLWLATKLRRDPRLQNPTLVIVTDRTDLDRQISDTFLRCGFPNPERAKSVQSLRDLLENPTGKTVTTTIQKFQELTGTGQADAKREKREPHPVLSEAENIFVLVDEAHRTQYSSLAANMRRALPRACFLGFTGTPIDKQDRSTLETFGSYIDTYTIEQAVRDDATVPIFYESRLPELRILGNSLDQVFDRVFADRTDEEREAIKQKHATEEAIAAAPKRIETICLDLLDHFTKFIQPNGFKAQVVAVSRETAVIYKETLDRLNAPESAVIMTVGHNDGDRFQKYKTSKQQQAELIRRFLDPKDPLALLVVCDMLLTGFDAPIEQVMYLDSPLKEHTLLQALARVNRKADAKTYGLVVDYWGVSGDLQEALAIFSPADVKGAMQPKVDELPRLQTRHQAALRFFAKMKNRDDLDECVAILEPEDVRAEFDQAFRGFSQSLDMLLPDPHALPYVDDLRWLGKIRGAARARYRDPGLDISDAGAKVKKLIEDVVIAEGIQLLVKEVSIFSKDFEEKVAALKSPEAKASEMEHAIRHEIHVRLEENPAFYHSLRQRLEEIIAERKQERIDAARQLQLFQNLIQEVRDEAGAARRVGLSDFSYAIYGVLHEGELPMVAEPDATYGDEAGRELATLIQEAIEPETQIIDWTRKDDVQRQMRQKVKRQLRAANYEAEKVEVLAGRIVDLAKVRKGK